MDDENAINIHNGIHSVLSKNEIMNFAAKWMELERIVLGEVI